MIAMLVGNHKQLATDVQRNCEPFLKQRIINTTRSMLPDMRLGYPQAGFGKTVSNLVSTLARIKEDADDHGKTLIEHTAIDSFQS
jgi:hypothetical protein